MDPGSLRAIAQRCRGLMYSAWSNVIQEQLRVWTTEFEEQAAILDLERLATEAPPKNSANRAISTSA